MENLPNIKKRPIAYFSLDRTSGWRERIKHNDNYWKSQIHKETNLGYDMIFESVKSDQEEKEGHLLNVNCVININDLITNIYKVLVCKEFAQ